MFLSASGKGLRLHSLKADLLNGFVEDADRSFLQDHRVRFACHVQRQSIALVAGAKQLLCGHEGDLRDQRINDLLGHSFHHIGLGNAGSNSVDPDALGAKLPGKGQVKPLTANLEVG